MVRSISANSATSAASSGWMSEYKHEFNAIGLACFAVLDKQNVCSYVLFMHRQQRLINAKFFAQKRHQGRLFYHVVIRLT
jgi:hypothetical protein